MGSEQSLGGLVMIPFLLLAGPEIDLPEREPECTTIRGGGLTEEVDDRGVPGFTYFEWRVCDE